MKSILPAMLILMFSMNLHAQTWQWGKRGGSQFNGVNSQPHEQIKDLATDKNGNVYALGLVESSGGAAIDGHSLTLNGFKDVVLTSYTCTGAYRWTKVIGGPDDDVPIAVKTDTLGHVYVATINYSPANFSNDTISSINSYKTLSLVEYDTSGAFKWLRQPQSDTGTFVYISNNSDSYDLYVAGNGDVYWFCQLPAGLVSGGGGWALPAPATCVVKYNAQGQMVNHITLQMQTNKVAFQGIGMQISKTGKIVIGGTYDNFNNSGIFSIGGQVITDHFMFLAAFSPTGQCLWKKSNTTANTNSRIYTRPQIDAQGNIYYCGGGNLGDSFNGFSFYNNLTTMLISEPFIGKADSNGNHLWIKCASGKSGEYVSSIALKNNNEIIMSGTGTSVWWDTLHHIQGAPNSGFYIYAARFDGSGNVLGMDSLKGTFGAYNFAYCNAVDKNGNLFIGGEFNLTLDITGTQSINNGGGNSDFFIAKYGYPCGCTAPASNFTSTNTAVKTVQFTYNGSTTIDSLRWNFGDGQTQKLTSNFTATLTHTYSSNGNYNACATVYNSCGSNSYCKQYPLSVGSISAMAGVKVYPTPTSDYLVIEGAGGATALLVNSIGQPVAKAALSSPKESLNTSALASGLYLLILQDKRGNKATMTINKQ